MNNKDKETKLGSHEAQNINSATSYVTFGKIAPVLFVPDGKFINFVKLIDEIPSMVLFNISATSHAKTNLLMGLYIMYRHTCFKSETAELNNLERNK